MFIGAWVQILTQVPDEGGQKRVTALSESEVWLNYKQYALDELRGLPLNSDTVAGFGFEQGRGNVWVMEFGDIRLTVSLKPMKGGLPCRRVAISGRFSCWNEEIRYVHELQRWWVDKVLLPYGLSLDLKWRDHGQG